MRKILPVFLSTFLLLSLVSTRVFAATLTLSDIGAVATAGKSYSHWWYTETNPILKGTADPAATVNVSIDTVSNTATADSSGVWQLATTMAAGDHTVAISSGAAAPINFTLTIGSSVPSGNGATPSGTPNTASPLYTTVVALGSVVALGIGAKLLRDLRIL